jgi:hypothetical protein
MTDIIKGKTQTSKKGGKRGMPAFVPTDTERRQAEALSGYGIPQDQIAALIRNGISIDTLRKYFAAELVTGKAKANAKVGKTLFQKAADGDTSAMIWWSKTQMRWIETSRLEHTSPDGTMSPAPVAVINWDEISDKALAEIVSATGKK